MTDALLKYVGVPGAVLASVAVTWQNFVTMGLTPRLVAMLILAIVLQLLLAQWLKPAGKARPVGFVPSKGPTPEGWGKRSGGLLVLLLAAVVSAGLAAILTARLVLVESQSGEAGAQILVLRAAWVEADQISLPLPANPVTCDYDGEGVQTTDTDWEQPDRTVLIHGFVAPQSITITCDGADPISTLGLTSTGSVSGPYTETGLRNRYVLIFIMGVLTWLIGVFRLTRG